MQAAHTRTSFLLYVPSSTWENNIALASCTLLFTRQTTKMHCSFLPCSCITAFRTWKLCTINLGVPHTLEPTCEPQWLWKSTSQHSGSNHERLYVYMHWIIRDRCCDDVWLVARFLLFQASVGFRMLKITLSIPNTSEQKHVVYTPSNPGSYRPSVPFVLDIV